MSVFLVMCYSDSGELMKSMRVKAETHEEANEVAKAMLADKWKGEWAGKGRVHLGVGLLEGETSLDMKKFAVRCYSEAKALVRTLCVRAETADDAARNAISIMREKLRNGQISEACVSFDVAGVGEKEVPS